MAASITEQPDRDTRTMTASLTIAEQRLHQIDRARRAVMQGDGGSGDASAAPWFDHGWIERSWRRCLANGQRPEQRLAFDVVPAHAGRRVEEANHRLLAAARPVLAKLGRALANSHYFAILTDAHGIVIDVDGPVASADRRAKLLTRIGVDLSEQAIGTTAIGAALAELQPVWLHRGEHFFDDTAVFSCAGAPLFGPDGRCAGMLDLTGINAPERPELKHLVAQWARSIENALALAQPHALMLRLNWPGCVLAGDGDGLLGLDAHGTVASVNTAGRQMLAQLKPGHLDIHASELFAMPWELLYDAARRDQAIEVPLWSGLVLQVLAQAPGAQPAAATIAVPRLPLREVETALIRRAVGDSHGNIQEAARILGISRATVYRKLGRK